MNKRAFTLIELLIVVAIIAILAAIAVPNFLEAQVRSKVARTMADCRTVAMAIQAYRVDHNKFPTPSGLYSSNIALRTIVLGATELSTPIAYVTTVDYKDPFKPEVQATPSAHGAGPTSNTRIPT